MSARTKRGRAEASNGSPAARKQARKGAAPSANAGAGAGAGAGAAAAAVDSREDSRLASLEKFKLDAECCEQMIPIIGGSTACLWHFRCTVTLWRSRRVARARTWSGFRRPQPLACCISRTWQVVPRAARLSGAGWAWLSNCRAAPKCAPALTPVLLARLTPPGSLYRKQNIVTILYGTSLTNKSALEIARQHAFAATHFSHTVRGLRLCHFCGGDSTAWAVAPVCSPVFRTAMYCALRSACKRHSAFFVRPPA